MANNRVQVKRTSTTGRTPNTTGSYATNSQYISAGELALNMTDGILYSSDGTNLITVGSNLATQRITSNITLDNNTQLRFRTVNSSAFAYFTQQNDDNFVFYTTNASYGARAVFSIFANSSTSDFQLGQPVTFNGANVKFSTGTALSANGSLGSAGQVLTSNGSTVYWSSISGSGSVNVAAAYTWTNLHTFSANVSFTGNGIGLTTNTAAIYLGGLADNNWKIGRNTGSTTKWRYTNNSIDIITANSNLEGFAIGLISGNSYFETGYLGTFIAANVTIGNSSVNTIINATAVSTNTVNVASKIQIGTPGAFDFASLAVIEIDANQNTYTQVVIQNANTGNSASADLVLTADTGNDSVDFIDFGINNSLYNQPNFNITGPKDGYLYASNGNISIGTASAKELIFHANGTTSNDRKLTVNATAITIANAVSVVANGSSGTSGQVLASNGSAVYWLSTSTVVRQSYTGDGLTTSFTVTGGYTANQIDVYVNGVKMASADITISSGTSVVFTVAPPNGSVIDVIGIKAAIMNYATVNTDASYTWTNTHSFTNTVTLKAISANGGLGTAGQALISNGTSTYWGNVSSVSGSDTQIQYNDGGFSNASAGFVFTKTTNNVTVANSLFAAVVNAASHTVGVSTIANSTGVYTGVVNGSSITVGTLFTANDTLTNTVSLLVSTNTSTFGTAAYIVANGNVGIGTSLPTSDLSISRNANNTLPSPPVDTVFHSVGEDTKPNRITLDSFGGTVNIVSRRSNGTAGAPSALLINEAIANFSSFGYGTTGYTTSSRAGILSYASENWTDSAQGTYWTFVTTSNGSTTATERMRIDSSGNIGIGNTAPSAKLEVTGDIKDSKGDIREIPVNNQTSAYVIVASDLGKVVTTTANVTVNGAIFANGDSVSFYNNSSANVTIIPGTGVTMYLAGTANTSNRTLLQRGLATAMMVTTNTFVISGAGLT